MCAEYSNITLARNTHRLPARCGTLIHHWPSTCQRANDRRRSSLRASAHASFPFRLPRVAVVLDPRPGGGRAITSRSIVSVAGKVAHRRTPKPPALKNASPAPRKRVTPLTDASHQPKPLPVPLARAGWGARRARRNGPCRSPSRRRRVPKHLSPPRAPATPVCASPCR